MPINACTPASNAGNVPESVRLRDLLRNEIRDPSLTVEFKQGSLAVYSKEGLSPEQRQRASELLSANTSKGVKTFLFAATATHKDGIVVPRTVITDTDSCTPGKNIWGTQATAAKT